MRRTFAVLSYAALFSTALAAGVPMIAKLEPRGSEQGRTFKLTVSGKNLGNGARITSTLPASFTPINEVDPSGGMMTPGGSASFLVEPKPDMVPGVYPVRVETTQGISNILLFTVGTFPEITEEESRPYAKPNSNDSIETAEVIRSTPITVNGTLRGAERDVFRTFAKAGERRVIEVEARRCGSAIDPVLRILDGSGKQLARSDDTPGTGLDARIDFTFPREGNYYVEVFDARFSRQLQNFYRLKMGSYAYADGIFPLGGKRGESTEVTFFGSNLKAPVKLAVDLRKAAPQSNEIAISLPGSPALPLLFAVGDLPELMEPLAGPVPVPSVINGRLSKAGEIDRYRIEVQPGEKLLFELQARDLGTSRLEGIITVYDSKGNKLDSAGDKPLPEDVFAIQGTSRTSNDPFLNFTVPKDAHEIVVAVEDLAQRGGPFYGYRLMTRRQAEDFQLAIASPYVNVPAGGTIAVSVVADRRGYDGPIQLSVVGVPKGIQAEGGHIPREFVDVNNARSFNRRGVLNITADPAISAADLSNTQLVIWGEGKLADGTTLRRRARGPGLTVDVAGATAQGVVDRQRPITADWLGFDLPAAVSETGAATLEVRQTASKRLDEGARYEFEYTWKIRSGTPLKDINADVIGARDIRVVDMKPAGNSGTFAVTTTKATDPARYDMYVSGRVKTDEGDVLIVSRPIPFEVPEGSAK